MGPLTELERALAQRLIDEMIAFNLQATGLPPADELVLAEYDDAGELLGGAYGWAWGETCWIEALWVRADARGSGVGSRLLAAAEARARAAHCTQLALDTHTFQAPDFYRRHGFEVVGTLPGYPTGHAQMLLRKPL